MGAHELAHVLPYIITALHPAGRELSSTSTSRNAESTSFARKRTRVAVVVVVVVVRHI